MHTVSVAEVEAYEFEHLIAASLGKLENKTLKAVVKNGRVHYEVHDNHQRVTATTGIAVAVDAYNRIG